MKAKGVIRDIVPWERAREYFFWRVRRRLAQDALVSELKAADATLTHGACLDDPGVDGRRGLVGGRPGRPRLLRVQGHAPRGEARRGQGRLGQEDDRGPPTCRPTPRRPSSTRSKAAAAEEEEERRRRWDRAGSRCPLVLLSTRTPSLSRCVIGRCAATPCSFAQADGSPSPSCWDTGRARERCVHGLGQRAGLRRAFRRGAS